MWSNHRCSGTAVYGIHAWWFNLQHALRHMRSGAKHSLSGAQVFRLQGRDDNTDVLRTEQRLTGGKDAYVV